MIINGNSLEILPTLPENSIDAIVTDPPYELGFMGKAWDSTGIAYNVELWRECLRVLKPGGHVLAFGGTRTFHRMACAIEDAGFQIRDQLQWIYGSGFPKSLDISKAIDKAKAAPEAEQWQGWGTALKPANEPICLARKPLDEKTVAANVLKWGTGGLNIDAGRIFRNSNDTSGWAASGSKASENLCMSGPNYSRSPKPDNELGRFPANVLFDEAAAMLLDEQAGIRTSGARAPGGKPKTGTIYGALGAEEKEWKASKGGASRFFYCAKASSKERNAGLEDMPDRLCGMSNGAQIHGDGYDKGQGIDLNRVIPKKNHHPTIKPIALMEYLIKLITPPGGVVLDPFAGSGTTLLAAKNLGFEAIGIELNPEYIGIIERRVAF